MDNKRKTKKQKESGLTDNEPLSPHTIIKAHFIIASCLHDYCAEREQVCYWGDGVNFCRVFQNDEEQRERNRSNEEEKEGRGKKEGPCSSACDCL